MKLLLSRSQNLCVIYQDLPNIKNLLKRFKPGEIKLVPFVFVRFLFRLELFTLYVKSVDNYKTENESHESYTCPLESRVNRSIFVFQNCLSWGACHLAKIFGLTF